MSPRRLRQGRPPRSALDGRLMALVIPPPPEDTVPAAMNDFIDKLSGRFIVIDGPDGAGKSTQLKLLAEFLQAGGLDVCQTRDPGGTHIGDKIREILLDRSNEGMAVECETMLYMASRAQLAAEVIRPALAAGRCVLCDRYISSTIAYQGAGGADTDAIRTAAEIATGGLWPDLTIILNLPAGDGLDRLPSSPDRMEAKGAAFHAEVRRQFLAQAEASPESFAVVDAAGNVEQVQERLRRVVLYWNFG